MKSDTWFFRFFREFPSLYFQLMGQPTPDPNDFVLEAAELKEVKLRFDGVFRPTQAGQSFYFFEAQLYRKPDFYLDWMAKVFLYLRQQAAQNEWRALVLFGTRGQDVPCEHLLGEFLASGRVRVTYLDELPDDPGGSLERSVLKLTTAKPDQLFAQAKMLAHQTRTEQTPVEQRSKLLAMIEAFVVANNPDLTREEIQAMLELHDIRESRIFKEAKLEGKLEGKVEGKVEGKIEGLMDAALRLVAKGHSLEQAAIMLDLDESTLRALTTQIHRGPSSN